MTTAFFAAARSNRGATEHASAAAEAVAGQTPAVIHGEVWHRRRRPAANAFRYPAFCLRLPLSQLAELPRRGIAHNTRAIVAFHDADHGARDGSRLETWIRALLAEKRIAADGEIVLYAFPRMFGYVFNPVSFWVCHDRAGGARAVLCEVSNTFGERHNYLLAHADGHAIGSGETIWANKAFHVSPFCEVKGRYAFRFHFGSGRWLARIDYFDDDGATPLLETAISGRASALERKAVRGLVWRYRLFTFGVIARIHWQACKLAARRVPVFAKPDAPQERTTR